jgi:enoyl-CoA hydratase/carnithine racemase
VNPAWVKRLPVDRATDFMTALLEVDQPVVAAVNGHAVGAGLRIAMLCDYVVVADDAKVGDPHVKRGLVAPQAVLLGELIGARRARSLVLGGRLLRGAEVVEWGLADEATSRDEVLGRALSQARELAALPPLAFRWTKRALNNRLKAAIAQYASEGYALESLTMLSTDHAEAAASFAEKRDPRPYEGR